LLDSFLFYKLTKALPVVLALGFLDPIDPITIPNTLNTFLTISRYNS
jgi:hypothetical protein